MSIARDEAHVHDAHGHEHATDGHGGHGARGAGPHEAVPGAGTPRSALAVALGLTAAFLVVEVVVGILSGSLALLADAGHMLGDSGALALSLVVAFVAARPRSARKTFGYRRAEVLAALAHAVALAVAATWIVMEAVERMGAPPPVHAGPMLAAAVAGLGVNLASAWVLHRRAGSGINVRAALAHVLGDALGSVAAIAAGLAMWIGRFYLADPLASVAISCLLVLGAYRLVREATHVLMEGTPEGLDVAALERTILDTPGVDGVHDLHVWEITPGAPMLTAHVVLAPGTHGTDVAARVGQRVTEAHAIAHVTIQPEPPEPAPISIRLKR